MIELDVAYREFADGLADVEACAPRVGGIAVGQHDEQIDVAGLVQFAPGSRSRTMMTWSHTSSAGCRASSP